MTLASECNNTTVHMGGANLKNLVSLLHPSKARATMACEILFVGREGYMNGKKAFIFGATFFFFFLVRSLGTSLQRNLHVHFECI